MSIHTPAAARSYFILPQERDRILIHSCDISVELQECMTRCAIVIDPGQFLYDWVRARVKTRQDYVLFMNTLHGCMDYGLFLSMQAPFDKIELSQKLRSFVADTFKELTTLANEKNFKAPDALSATEVARQVKLQIEMIPTSAFNAALSRANMSTADFLHSELAVLAQHGGYTLEEYLGPATHNDLSANVAFIRALDAQFKNTADKVLVEKPDHADVFEHFKFLAEMFQKFASYPVLRRELKGAIIKLGSKTRWPMVGAAAQRAVGGHNPIIDAEFLGMLNLGPAQ